MTDEFQRNPDGFGVADEGIVRVVEEGSGELVARFNHDGSIPIPAVGKRLELEHASPKEGGGRDGELEFDTLGEYEVSDVSYKYTLAEWTDEDGERVDKMFGTVVISVTEPSGDDSSE